MLQYATWKYVVAAIVIALSVFYSLPNLYPKDPAVQVAANRGSVVDDALVQRTKAALSQAELVAKSVAIEGDHLLVRAADAATQAEISDLLREQFDRQYTVALSSATTVPRWLSMFGARPMSLGLDLQGGVQFLLQVDRDAAIEKRANGYAEQVAAVLRDGDLPYSSVARTPDGIEVLLEDAADMTRVRAALGRQVPDLELVVDATRADRLVARMTPTLVTTIMDQAIDQNRTTLENRINSLGVGEQVIQRQGEARIAVQLPGVQDTAEARRLIGATATLEYRHVVDYGLQAMEAARTGVVPPTALLYYSRELGPDGKPRPILLSRRSGAGLRPCPARRAAAPRCGPRPGAGSPARRRRGG